MGEILTFSQSTLLQLSKNQRGTSSRVQRHVDCRQSFSAGALAMNFLPTRLKKVTTVGSPQKQLYCEYRAGAVKYLKTPTTFSVVSAGIGGELLTDSGGSNDNFTGGNGNSGDGGTGNGGNNNNKDKGGPDESGDHNSGDAKKVGMSMSQKLTLGYAALVGIGGLMGYIKGGSQKSLLAGGLSVLLLYFVYNTLPTNPVLASYLGLGLSVSLLVVMGSRFKRSGKIFPAGVVSLVSLVMSAGYFHGVLRSLH